MSNDDIFKNICRLTLLTFLTLPAATAVTCYNPPAAPGENGTAQVFTYTTCNINQEASMCCRQTQAGDDTPDSCLPNGLCVNYSTSKGTTYWKESCTDPTWTSPYCVRSLDSCSMDHNFNAEVTPCPNDPTEYCCGNNNTDCCGTASAFIVPTLDAPQSSTTGTTSTPTSTTSTPTSTPAPTSQASSTAQTSTSQTSSTSQIPSTSQISSASQLSSAYQLSSTSQLSSASHLSSASEISETSTTSPTSSPSSHAGLSTGVRAGIGAGVGAVAIAAILALGFYLMKRRKAETNNMANLVPENKGRLLEGTELDSYAVPGELPDINHDAILVNELHGDARRMR